MKGKRAMLAHHLVIGKEEQGTLPLSGLQPGGINPGQVLLIVVSRFAALPDGLVKRRQFVQSNACRSPTGCLSTSLLKPLVVC